MNFPFFIARRYLFSKKSTHVINVISSISVIGVEILKNINANEKTIRFDVGKKVRNQLRIIPELRFFLDDSLDYLEHIDELLKK